MRFEFLKTASAQSSMRVMTFMLTAVICLNLLTLPILMYVAIKAGQELGWLIGYLGGLAGLSGTTMAGKVMQKKYEEPSNEKPAE